MPEHFLWKNQTMKKIFAMSLAAVLSLSLLAGCTGKEQNGTPAGGQTGTPSVTRPASDYVGGPAGGKPAQKVEVNFERRVAAVEDGKVTLEDGTVSQMVRILPLPMAAPGKFLPAITFRAMRKTLTQRN